MFQFTHPGGVRLRAHQAADWLEFVSIHAPGRGATHTCVLQGVDDDVSIHAPGRGATLRKHGLRCSGYCFNSRTREGCDCSSFSGLNPALMFQFTHPGGVRQYGAKLRIMGRINKRNLRLAVLL